MLSARLTRKRLTRITRAVARTLPSTCAALSLCLTATLGPAWATPNDNPRRNTSIRTPLAPNTDTDTDTTSTTLPSLPREQIKRFVTTIAVIKHYYIKPVTDSTLFTNAVRGMVTQLDPHSSFLDADDLRDLKTTVSGQFVGIGIELTTDEGALKVISPLAGTPAEKAGIKSNDLIIKIDGKLIQNMSLRDAVNHIKGPKGTFVHLTILRKGLDQPLKLSIMRNTIHLQTVKSKQLTPGYGYIRITFFQGPVEKLLRDAIVKLKAESKGKLKGLILDLRNNPGGLLNVSATVVDTFLDSTSYNRFHHLIVYTQGRIKGSNTQYKAHPGDLIKGIPMVVLINGGSASASEIVAGALQDYKRALIVGTRSFGKGSVQTVLPVSEHSAIKLTTALYHTPSGRVIQAKGIQPDVSVPDMNVDQKAITGRLDIDESDYENHLPNQTDSAKADKKKKAINVNKKEEMTLAKKDFQLYTALLILKGLHAERK